MPLLVIRICASSSILIKNLMILIVLSIAYQHVLDNLIKIRSRPHWVVCVHEISLTSAPHSVRHRYLEHECPPRGHYWDNHPGLLLQTWFNFNPSMGTWSHAQYSEVWEEIINPSPNFSSSTVEVCHIPLVTIIATEISFWRWRAAGRSDFSVAIPAYQNIIQKWSILVTPKL